jgi:transcriptional regulator with XRE-family HTH domain
MTFGRVLSEARKQAGLSQKELAERVKKEDGEPISPQYLNDIEHDRRNPPSEYLIEQFARVLDTPPEVLYYEAGKLTPETQGLAPDKKRVVAAYKAFRKSLEEKKR